jgi:hypothetical protein
LIAVDQRELIFRPLDLAGIQYRKARNALATATLFAMRFRSFVTLARARELSICAARKKVAKTPPFDLFEVERGARGPGLLFPGSFLVIPGNQGKRGKDCHAAGRPAGKSFL